MTLSAKKQSRWLVAILIAALVLPWCRVMCATAPVLNKSEHCATHSTLHTGAKAHSHLPTSLGSLDLDCPDNQQSITANNHYSSLDSVAKQLPIWFAIASAFVFIFAISDSSAYAFFRTQSPFAPPIRRHLLLCVLRD